MARQTIRFQTPPMRSPSSFTIYSDDGNHTISSQDDWAPTPESSTPKLTPVNGEQIKLVKRPKKVAKAPSAPRKRVAAKRIAEDCAKEITVKLPPNPLTEMAQPPENPFTSAALARRLTSRDALQLPFSESDLGFVPSKPKSSNTPLRVNLEQETKPRQGSKVNPNPIDVKAGKVIETHGSDIFGIATGCAQYDEGEPDKFADVEMSDYPSTHLYSPTNSSNFGEQPPRKGLNPREQENEYETSNPAEVLRSARGLGLGISTNRTHLPSNEDVNDSMIDVGSSLKRSGNAMEPKGRSKRLRRELPRVDHGQYLINRSQAGRESVNGVSLK